MGNLWGKIQGKKLKKKIMIQTKRDPVDKQI